MPTPLDPSLRFRTAPSRVIPPAAPAPEPEPPSPSPAEPAPASPDGQSATGLPQPAPPPGFADTALVPYAGGFLKVPREKYEAVAAQIGLDTAEVRAKSSASLDRSVEALHHRQEVERRAADFRDAPAVLRNVGAGLTDFAMGAAETVGTAIDALTGGRTDIGGWAHRERTLDSEGRAEGGQGMGGRIVQNAVSMGADLLAMRPFLPSGSAARWAAPWLFAAKSGAGTYQGARNDWNGGEGVSRGRAILSGALSAGIVGGISNLSSALGAGGWQEALFGRGGSGEVTASGVRELLRVAGIAGARSIPEAECIALAEMGNRALNDPSAKFTAKEVATSLIENAATIALVSAVGSASRQYLSRDATGHAPADWARELEPFARQIAKSQGIPYRRAFEAMKGACRSTSLAPDTVIPDTPEAQGAARAAGARYLAALAGELSPEIAIRDGDFAQILYRANADAIDALLSGKPTRSAFREAGFDGLDSGTRSAFLSAMREARRLSHERVNPPRPAGALPPRGESPPPNSGRTAQGRGEGVRALPGPEAPRAVPPEWRADPAPPLAPGQAAEMAARHAQNGAAPAQTGASAQPPARIGRRGVTKAPPPPAAPASPSPEGQAALGQPAPSPRSPAPTSAPGPVDPRVHGVNPELTPAEQRALRDRAVSEWHEREVEDSPAEVARQIEAEVAADAVPAKPTTPPSEPKPAAPASPKSSAPTPVPKLGRKGAARSKGVTTEAAFERVHALVEQGHTEAEAIRTVLAKVRSPAVRKALQDGLRDAELKAEVDAASTSGGSGAEPPVDVPLARETSAGLDERYPGWNDNSKTSSGADNTQITGTVASYRRIGQHLQQTGQRPRILDASSGKGEGTRALREMGFDVSDAEPYPGDKREPPTYSKLNYEDAPDESFDLVISNAVLNVIPDDWRDSTLAAMARKVAPGGRMVVNVRDAQEVAKIPNHVEIDSPSEVLVTQPDGTPRHYQKGFTQPELEAYISKNLGDGWTVERATPANSGLPSGSRAIVATRADTPAAKNLRALGAPVTPETVREAEQMEFHFQPGSETPAGALAVQTASPPKIGRRGVTRKPSAPPAQTDYTPGQRSRAYRALAGAAEGRAPAPADLALAHEMLDRGLPVDQLLRDRFAGQRLDWPVTGMRVNHPGDVAACCSLLRNPFQETTKALYLDKSGDILAARVVALGTVNSAFLHPHSILSDIPPGAVSVCIAHNHPSGDPSPSSGDLRSTRVLKAAADALGLKVFDHVITDTGRFYSFRQNGLADLGEAPRNWGHVGIAGAADEIPDWDLPAPWEGDAATADARPQITAPEAARDIAGALTSHDARSTYVLHLDQKNKVAGISKLGPAPRPLDFTRSLAAHPEATGAILLLGDGAEAAAPSLVPQCISAAFQFREALLDAVDMKRGVSWRRRGLADFDGDLRAPLSAASEETVPWDPAFPRAVVHTTRTSVMERYRADFDAAKSGDADAAARLVRATVKMDRVRDLAARHPGAIVVPVRAEEATGRNRIPSAYAKLLSAAGLQMDTGIVQSVRANHSGASGNSRIFSRAAFDGPVEKGREYVIVDDHITQGGTVGELRSYIESRGGKVVEATSLTASKGSTILSIRPETVSALEAKFGKGLPDELHKAGIASRLDALTESEGRYLLKLSPDTLRDRLAAGGLPGGGVEDGLPGPLQLEEPSAPYDAGARPDPQAPSSRPDSRAPSRVSPISPGQVTDLARSLWPDIPIVARGSAPTPRSGGEWQRRDSAIRLARMGDLEALSRSLGEMVWDTAGLSRSLPRSAIAELDRLAAIEAGGAGAEPPADVRRRLFGDFLHDWLSGDEPVYSPALRAPFDDWLASNPQEAFRLFAMHDAYARFRMQDPDQALAAAIGQTRAGTVVSPRTLPQWLAYRRQQAASAFRKLGRRVERHWFDDKAPLRDLIEDTGAAPRLDPHAPGISPSERANRINSNPYLLAEYFQGRAGEFAAQCFLGSAPATLIGGGPGAGGSGGPPDSRALSRVDGPARVLAPINGATAADGRALAIDDFLRYAVARRGLSRYFPEGRDLPFTKEQAEAVVAKHQCPEYDRALQGITDYAHHLLGYLEESGALTAAERKAIEDANPIYIPLMREFSEAGGSGSPRSMSGTGSGGSPIHKLGLKGSLRDIKDPLESLARQTQQIIATAQRSTILKALVQLYDSAREGDRIGLLMREVDAPKGVVGVEGKTIYASLMRHLDAAERAWAADHPGLSGVLPAEMVMRRRAVQDWAGEFWARPFQLLAPDSRAQKPGQNVVRIHLDGKTRWFEIDNPDLLRELTPQKADTKTIDSLALEWCKRVNDLTRLGATSLNDKFGLVLNPIRDTFTALLNGQYATPGAPLLSNLGAAIRANADAESRLWAETGMAYTMGNHASERTARRLAGMARARTALGRAWRQGLARTVSDLLSFSEAGPRLREYLAARRYWAGQCGDGPGAADAAQLMAGLAGQDVTVNFRRGGDASRKISNFVLFANAGIQTYDKFLRALGAKRAAPWEKNQSRGARFRHAAPRAIALAAFSVAAAALRKALLGDEDKKRYDELPGFEKYAKVHLPVGAKNLLGLPVAFEAGMLFQSLPTAFLDYSNGDKNALGEWFDTYLSSLPVTLPVGATPEERVHSLFRNWNLAAPFLDVEVNRNWHGAPIADKTATAGKPKREWKDERTTLLATGISDAINKVGDKTGWKTFSSSPIGWQYLLDTFGGGLVGRTAEWASDLTHPSRIAAGGDLSTLPGALGAPFTPLRRNKLEGEFFGGRHDLHEKADSGEATLEELGELALTAETYAKLGDYYARKGEARRAAIGKEMTDADLRRELLDIDAHVRPILREHAEKVSRADLRAFGLASVMRGLTSNATSDARRELLLGTLTKSGVGYDEARLALLRRLQQKGSKPDYRRKVLAELKAAYGVD